MAYSGSSYGAAGGGSSSATTATTGSASIPDGARVLLCINVGDSTTATPSAVPSGFSSIASALNSNANNGKLGKLMVYEKKVAASEASTYTVTFATAFDFDVTAVWFTGRHATTAATVSAADNQASSGTLPISIGAAGLTAAANDDIIAFYGAEGNGYAGTWSGTVPSGYTERHEGNCGAGAFGSYVATLDNASAGATGTLTATMTNASLTGADATAIIIALPVAAGGSNTTRTLDDTLTIFDEPIRGSKFGRTLDDLLTVFDDSYPFKIFEVIIDESYDVIDQLIPYRKYVRQLDDSNAVVDELLKAAIYGRLQSDSLVTFDDAIIGTLHGVTATDSLVTIDDLLAYRKFYRRLDDTTDVIDLLTASSSGITVYVVTIDDSIVIYDDTLRCVAYSRGLDEPLTIVDSLNKSVAYCRQSSDALDCFDELYASRWFRQLIDEQVSVVDSLIASITTPAPTSVAPLPVRIGLVRDFIKIGVIH